MKKIIILFIASLSFISAVSQNGYKFQKVLPAGCYNCGGNFFSTFENSDYVVAGAVTTTATIDFDQTSGSYNLTPLGGEAHGTLAKYSKEGNIIWARLVSTAAGTEQAFINATDIDSNGDVYAIGSFRGTASFNVGGIAMETRTFTPTVNSYDMVPFLAKYDGDSGELLELKVFETASFFLKSLNLDNEDNVFLAGIVGTNQSVNVDPGNTNSSVFGQAVLIKFSPQGVLLWAKPFTSPNSYGLLLEALTVDSDGNVIIGGASNSPTDFDPGPGEALVTGQPGVRNSFLAKYRGNGDFVWVRAGLSNSGSFVKALNVDSKMNLLVIGIYSGVNGSSAGEILFGSETSNTVNLVGNNDGQLDIYFLKFDANGELLWAKTITGNEAQIVSDGKSMTFVDRYDDVSIFASSYASVDIDPGPNVNIRSFGSNFSSLAFLAKYNGTDGTFIDGFSISGANANAANIDKDGRIILSGWSSDGSDFDPSSGVAIPNPIGGPYLFAGGFLAIYKQMPLINSIGPLKVVPGDILTINGKFLGVAESTKTIKINGVTASNIIDNGIDVIKVEVPIGATAGKVTVTVDGLLATSAQDVFVLAPQPVNQPTVLSLTNVSINSLNVSFNSALSTDGYIVLRKSGSAPAAVPDDGNMYSIGNSLGDATVAYFGGETSFSDVNLLPNTTYHYAVFSYRGSGTAINYLTTSPLVGSRSTLVNEPGSAPTALNFPAFSTTSLGGAFTATTADGYLVLQRATSSPTGIPVDGTTYSVGNTIGDGTVVAVGPATTFSSTSLTASTVYHYDIIAFNGSGNITNYNTNSILEGSRTTLQTEPAAQPTAILFNNITISSLVGTFTIALASPSGYLVIRKQGSASTGVPVDGTVYSAGSSLSDGTIVSVGTLNNFTDAGLVAGTIYHYSIFSYNGEGMATNYLVSNPATTSVITISAAPTTAVATNIQQSSFTANWATVTGAASYVLDVSIDNFSTFVSGYAAKSVTGINENVTGLTSGIDYQYRVRAVNASGQSTNSNTITQITVPQTPTTTTASNIRSNDFKANWSDVVGESGYELDVSSNNFVSFITGYQGKSISANVIEEIVTGLSPSTTYQYRVRSKNAGGVSPNSETITTSTTAVGGNSPLAISDILSPSTIQVTTAPITITVSVSGGSGTKNVTLFYRSITANSFVSVAMTNSTGNAFTASIPANASDDLGIEFYISATASSETAETTKRLIYRSVSASQTTAIPTITQFGGTLESYQIISIPAQLEDNLIASIFEPSLGAYDETKWRLVRYQGGRNVDYQAGLTRINQGESYWFNSVSEVSVKPGASTVARANQSAPFILSLTQGWNQIATPYPFAIDWDDVLAANGNPTGVGKYKVYVPSSINFAESNNLQPFSGGFVFTDQARTLNLPVTLKNTAGRRKAPEFIGSDISSTSWTVPIQVSQGRALNPLGSIGMRPEAKAGKDDFDDITLPRFVKYLELNSYHHEFLAPRFSKDIVPTAEEHRWNLTIESNFDEGDITLSWAGVDLGANNAQLILYDPAQGVLLDMKKVKTHTIRNTDRHEVEILYSRENSIAVEGAFVLGKPYPNPSSLEVSFNVFSWSPSHTKLEVYDMMGRKVFLEETDLRGKQMKTLTWDSHENGKAQSGVYIYKIISTSSEKTNTIQGRIIIH